MTTKKEVELTNDPGDKISASLSFKMSLKNYQNMDFYAGCTVTKRESETDEQAWERVWGIVDRELEKSVQNAKDIIEKAEK